MGYRFVAYKDAPHAEMPYHVKELNTVDGYVRDFGELESPAVQATWLVRALSTDCGVVLRPGKEKVWHGYRSEERKCESAWLQITVDLIMSAARSRTCDKCLSSLFHV